MKPSESPATSADTTADVVGLANVVVHVSDVDASISFYGEILGLQLGFDTGWKSPTDMLAVTGTPPGTAMRLARLLIPETHDGITLSAFEGFGSIGTQPFERAGAVHFGLVVADLSVTLGKLADHGVLPFGEPTELGPPHARSRLAFVRDPDGVVVELVQHGVQKSDQPADENEVDN